MLARLFDFGVKSAPIGLLLVTLCACSPDKPAETGVSEESAAPSMTAAEAASLMASATAPNASGMAQAGPYVGQWKGPEGTSMTVTPESSDDDVSHFDVAIRNLDGTRNFAGTLQGDGLHIDRDGKALIIHPGNGKDTGMKWLADKQNCLVVDANEGYCRD